MSEVTRILQSIESGDVGESAKADELLPLVYDELRRLAAAKLAREARGHTLQPTALVHEAWLRMCGENPQLTLKSRAHFIGVAAEAMRRILVESARRKASQKRGGNRARLYLQESSLVSPIPGENVLLLNEALVELESKDPQKARIVVLKFFAGLTNSEVAENLGVTERTIERAWSYAKSWLFHAITNGAEE